MSTREKWFRSLLWWIGLVVLVTIETVLNTPFIVTIVFAFMYGFLTSMAGYYFALFMYRYRRI